jgi:hypothetical protein
MGSIEISEGAEPDMKDVARWVVQAWTEITEHDVYRSWRKTGFS